jgi:hypothetical protein
MHLHKTGESTGILDRMITMDERGKVTQKDRLEAIEKRFVHIAT